MMRVVAVIGGGIRGLVSAYVLAKAGVDVVVYEEEEQLGGHGTRTFNFDHAIDLDLGLLFLNPATYPTTLELFESLGIDDVDESDVSFSVSHGYEWGTRHGLSSLFADKKNTLNPYFWQLLREINKFKDEAISYIGMLETNPEIDRNETLGQFIKSRGYSETFQNTYLLYGRPQWLTIRKHSDFVKKVRDILESKGCQLKAGCQVHSVLPADNGSIIVHGDGFQETYNGCIMAVDAPTAVRLLGNQATFEETRVLGAFQYSSSDVFLHRDSNLMPKNQSVWSAMNFIRSSENKACLTYWLNVLQNVGETSLPFFMTLNPNHTPNNTLLKWSTNHLLPTISASKASLELDQIQGKRGIWFCGYNIHEDEFKAGMVAANGILGKHFPVLNSQTHLSLSFAETGARLLVTKFFQQFISTGCIILLEEGGRTFTFKGSMEKCPLKTVLRVHSPQFYWKIMTEADLGLADAYINGDFSFVDKDRGLLNLFLILIANKELNSSASQLNKKRGWWSPALFTAGIASAKYFLKHVLRHNSLTQARRNISRHYDLSNEHFALFLGETMQYSSGIFKNDEDEDLKAAQERKISSLIDKARIEKWHEVLDIGSGWGTFAIEVVKRTGCKYTGITLSEQQLKFAEAKVKEAGLQDKIKFLLSDYRQLPDTCKYDRIISCEMIEHVGNEYIDEFFRCCESLLAQDGLFILQFISIPEEQFEEYRRSPGFIKEYIFPGGCLLPLSRILSAMAAASRLSVEHVENIGSNYFQTLRCWRKNFLENRSKILGLGFDEKFIRTWEYYFDYCASGFKSRTLGDYQVVFARPGNFGALGEPYKGGIRGLVSAYILAKAGVDVVIYEKEEQLGGHGTRTFNFDHVIDLDLGFLFLNPATYPTTLELFESLGIDDVDESDVSFSVSHGYEWGTRHGFSSLFADKKNTLNPYFWQLLREINKFKDEAISYVEMLETNPEIDRNETLGQFIKSRGYSETFQSTYLATICGSIWCCSTEKVLSFSAFSTLSFCCSHNLFQLLGRPQWLTIRKHSNFVKKVRDILESRGCQLKAGCQVHSVLPADDGSIIVCVDGFQETYSGCIMAVNAPSALHLLGNQATFEEIRVLGAFQYSFSDIFLHTDSNLMPKNQSAWSALNFIRSSENKACLTYWLNVLQTIHQTIPCSSGQLAIFFPLFLHQKLHLSLMRFRGSEESGSVAGMAAAHGILGKHFPVMNNQTHLSLSLAETVARLLVTKFFQQYISTGCIILLEEGGRVFTYKGSMEKCSLKTVLKVHNPQFYWKIMTEADLGLADAYINGDFSFIDKDRGLLNLFLIFIANKDLNSSASQLNKKRGWWSPALFTAGIASAKYFLKHVLRQNTLTQARRNISRHYDLLKAQNSFQINLQSNEHFALFMDETMQYSSGIFKNEDEDLKVAQERKISSLIDKERESYNGDARIEKWHEVLDIGSGWGIFAIEVVKRTGCKYTGITLSEQQLEFAESKVKEAGLQDKIKFLLCDYRQIPDTCKYDRIIACEMTEHVGNEYIDEFFRCCESLLAQDGLFILQFISIPEELFGEYIHSPGFVKEYIFPGGCLLPLSRMLSAMAAGSRLSVEHVENIGSNYFQTLRCWRKNFLENRSKILGLGFDEKFIRTWEYYFDYCASGFKSRTLNDYQVVFARPGNFGALGEPYKGFPSAYSYID
ncbi:Amine oxidase [Corchorus olitorius]|uniref:Amine oxidase n=1 Tax=Corchorus olitorius TaxID=93759 RepID=A0A1R3JKS2_9ROSI|nr:Amine oxidase [Corchorus olitorius]